MTLTRVGDGLVVTLNSTGETTTVINQFLGSDTGLEELQLADTTLDRQEILDIVGDGAPNTPPIVAGPITDGAAEDSGVRIVDLLAGASDTDGDTLHVANLTGLVAFATLNGDSLQVDTGNAAFQHLAAGSPQPIVVNYDVTDGNGGSVPQSATFTVTGVNDAAQIGGGKTGSVTEDGQLTATGTLTVTDADTGEASFQAGTFAGAHGSLALTAAGGWTYTLDNADTAVQALNTGGTLPDAVTVHAFDGTAASIAITIHGADEPAGNTAPIVAGPITDGAAEDSGVRIVDLLAGASDTDGDTLHVANLTGLVAGATLNGDSLQVDTGNAAFQHLAAGSPQPIVVNYDVTDGNGGSVPQSATFTVTGVNDAAQIGGGKTGSVTEDGQLTATGTLTVTDADTGEASFQAGTFAGAHGSLALTAAGGWTYTLDNADTAVQALNTGGTLPDAVTVHAFDGTAASIAITIHGADEPAGNTAPIVAGPITDGAAEDSGVRIVDLLAGASDTDGDTLHVANLTGLVAGATLNGDSLQVDTGNAAFQHLAAGSPQPIVVNYDVTDGNGGSVPQSATFTVTGVNDAAQIGGGKTGSVTEDGQLTATGTLTVTDADTGEASFQAGTFAGAHGSLALTAAGGWTYTLDNADTAVQALNTGGTLPDAVTVHAFDGTAASIAITIHGADEPAGNVITGTDGRNFLRGTPGDDMIDARGGSDTVNARAGDDIVFAGSGNDVVNGQAGDDEIHGGPGRDHLFGGLGDDLAFGDDGNDWLDGDGGNDVMHGGKGRDVLDGDGGNDRLFGDEGNDVVRGGKGKDLIEGGAGKDWLSGGKDSDTFVFGPEFGRDVITDFHVKGSAHDVIEFSTDVFANWMELESAITDTCRGAMITVDCDNSITLLDVSKAQLVANHAADFQSV